MRPTSMLAMPADQAMQTQNPTQRRKPESRQERAGPRKPRAFLATFQADATGEWARRNRHRPSQALFRSGQIIHAAKQALFAMMRRERPVARFFEQHVATLVKMSV